MNSDKIFVIDQGNVLEQGKFSQLHRFKGIKFESEDDPIDEGRKRK